MIKKVIVLFLIILSNSVQAADLQVLFVGLPQSGPPITLLQSYAKNIKIPYTLTGVKDCASSLQAIEKNNDVAYMIANTTTITSIRHGVECMPKFKADDVVFVADNYFNYCRKPGNNKDFYRSRIVIGAASVVPIDGIASDLNKQNGTNLVAVSMPSSVNVATSIINGDLDWGLVVTSVSDPLIQSKQLECPYTTNPKSSNYIAKHFQVLSPDLTISWVMVAKTKDSNIKTELMRAAQTAEFNNFLEFGKFTNIKTKEITDRDIDKFYKRIQETVTNFKG
jgi:hypothetical protein